MHEEKLYYLSDHSFHQITCQRWMSHHGAIYKWMGLDGMGGSPVWVKSGASYCADNTLSAHRRELLDISSKKAFCQQL